MLLMILEKTYEKKGIGDVVLKPKTIEGRKQFCCFLKEACHQ